ncbi:hypothetical protein B0H11DRAFT_2047172 [Mycena galericulata]|nr:hypothetical protein B0H11DRAFT_2047172 [Mycena galericulata]
MQPCCLSLGPTASLRPFSGHGLASPTESIPNSIAFRQPSGGWSIHANLPPAPLSFHQPEQLVGYETALVGGPTRKRALGALDAGPHSSPTDDGGRYKYRPVRRRLSLELCNEEGSDQPPVSVSMLRAGSPDCERMWDRVRPNATQRLVPRAEPVIYASPHHAGDVPRDVSAVAGGRGTSSRAGGVRRRHDAAAPGEHVTVRVGARRGAGGHGEGGARSGVGASASPPRSLGAAGDAGRWVGTPFTTHTLGSRGASTRHYQNIAASDFDILPGAVALTKHYTEDIFFQYPNKTVSSGFRYLDHPLVAHIVPYIRRPSRRSTVSPEYLAAMVRRALPIFKTHFQNYTSAPKSALLNQFISALHGLGKLLPDELAVALNRLILPDIHATNNQLPINFELPTFPSLPKNTPVETYEYSDDERLAMSHFNDPVFKHIFPFWRRPEIIEETDPDHIAALLARFRLGISAFLHWIIGVREAAPSTSFAPIVAVAIQNTALAVKMLPQNAETRSWLDALPEFPEYQELEFPALAFPPNESVGFPPKWQPSPDPSPSESPGSNSSFLHNEALQAPQPLSVHGPGEDPNRGSKPSSSSEIYVKDNGMSAYKPNNGMIRTDPHIPDDNDDVPEAIVVPDVIDRSTERPLHTYDTETPVLRIVAPESYEVTSARNEPNNNKNNGMIRTDPHIPDENDDVPEAIVVPSAIDRDTERTLQTRDTETPVVRIGSSGSCTYPEPISARNEQSNNAAMMSVNPAVLDKNDDLVLGGATEKSEVNHDPSNETPAVHASNRNSTPAAATEPSAMRNAVHRSFPTSAAHEHNEALASTASQIFQFLTELQQHTTDITIWPRPIGFMDGTERRRRAKHLSSLAKYSYFAECFREKAPGRMWIGMFVTPIGRNFGEPAERHVWAAIIISPEAPAQGKKLLIYDSEGPDVDFQQCRAKEALRNPIQLGIWQQQKTPFAELWRSNYDPETVDQKQCLKDTREFLLRAVKRPPCVKAGPDGETVIDGFQRVSFL